MKRAVLWIALFLMVAGTVKSAQADVVLAKGNVARVAIYVTPELAGKKDSLLLASVKDLAHYLGKISGSTVSTVAGAPTPDNKLLPILIGDLALKAFGAPKKTSSYDQGWRLVVSDKGIGMIGQSEEATSYAVYELLDRLGCRWYMPSEMGESIPSTSTLTIPVMDISEVPRVMRRIIWYADDDYKRRNRLGGIFLSISHALEEYLSPEVLAAHLDWNAEIGGKRSVNGRLCWGNPEVAAAVADKIIEGLDSGLYKDSVSLSPNDGADWCECSKCKALDAGDWDTTFNSMSITDRLIHFENQIAERVNKKYPNVLFGNNAYVQYTRPPVREKVDPHIVPVLAPITYCRAHSMDNKDCPTRQDLRHISEGWLKASKNVSLYEFGWNLADQVAPFPMITKWGQDLKFLYDRGLNFWTPETQPNFDASLPGLYMGIRMSWYPGADPAQIMDEFYPKFYGPAAAPMRKFWTIFDDAWTNVPEHAGGGFGYEARFTPEVLQAGRNAVDEALAACKPDSVEFQRVKIADERMRSFEMFMAMQRKLYVFYTGQHDLAYDSAVWMENEKQLSHKYKDQSAFTYVGYGPGYNKAGSHFFSFYQATYTDAARIAKDFNIVTNLGFPLREWKYKIDRKNEGEKAQWFAPGLDESDWPTTDVCVQTWSDLGLFGYYGTVWYRGVIGLPDGLTKKVYLWFSRIDGKFKLFVNGKHVPYVNEKGVKTDEFSGFSVPISVDITEAMAPGNNSISLRAERPTMDEIGIGGLMGPTVVYTER